MSKMLDCSEIKDLLQENVLEIVFTKKDGTERTILCTTKADLIAPTSTNTPKEPRQENNDPDLFRVTDVARNEWRSFRYDQIKSVKLV